MNSQSDAPWKKHFNEGVAKFKKQQCEAAVICFKKAIKSSGDTPYIVYDSRAAAYMKLGKPKEALQDSKKVIDLVPDRWQGYRRAAQAFISLKKFASAVKMTDLALERMGDSVKNADRRREVEDIRFEAIESAESSRVRATNHFAKLPVEIIRMIFEVAASHSPTIVPVLLSHVCNHWRTIALAQCSLWSSLVLREKRSPIKIQTWQERSGGRVEDLRFDRPLSSSEFAGIRLPLKTPSPVLLALHGIELSHLKTLTLDGGDLDQFRKCMADAGLGSLISRVPEFEYRGEESDNIFLRPRIFPREHEFDPLLGEVADVDASPSSNLRVLTLQYARCDWKHLAFHCGNLVSVTVLDHPREADPIPMRILLQTNPVLEQLIIQCQPSPPLSPIESAHEFVTERSLTLPRLRHLEFSRVEAAHEIIEGFSLPGLQILRLHSLPAAAATLRCIVEDVDTPLLSLQELSITTSHVQPRTLVRALLQAHGLQTLQLNKAQFSANDIAEVLTQPPVDLYSRYTSTDLSPATVAITCPSLVQVDFSQCEDLKTGPLIRMVSARLAHSTLVTASDGAEGQGEGDVTLSATAASAQIYPVQRIRSLKVNECPRIEAEALPWLRSNIPVFKCQYMMKKQASTRR